MTYLEASARLDYAVQAMLALSAVYPERIKGADLARKQQLPLTFLRDVLAVARRASLVQARLGPEGGYRLTRPPALMTLAEVVRALDGPLTMVRGETIGALTYAGAARHLGDVWAAIDASVCAVMQSVTLADILAGQLPTVPATRSAADP